MLRRKPQVKLGFSFFVDSNYCFCLIFRQKMRPKILLLTPITVLLNVPPCLFHCHFFFERRDFYIILHWSLIYFERILVYFQWIGFVQCPAFESPMLVTIWCFFVQCPAVQYVPLALWLTGVATSGYVRAAGIMVNRSCLHSGQSFWKDLNWFVIRRYWLWRAFNWF